MFIKKKKVLTEQTIAAENIKKIFGAGHIILIKKIQ